MGAEEGVAEGQNKDRTGAPGSQNACNNSTCHTAGAFNPSSTIQVLDQSTNMMVSEYTPGETYDLRFTVNSSGGEVFGFQATVVKDDDASNAGSLQSPGSFTQLENVGGRHIIEHSAPNPNSSFMGEWVAPAVDVGSVTFYMSGLAANDSGTDGGDGYDGTSLTLTPPTVGIDDVFDSLNTIVQNNTLQIQGLNQATLQIFNLHGQVVLSNQFSGNFELDLSTLDNGLYILAIESEGQGSTKKITLL
jgi:hypothetical protein